ncbi:type 1 glutamine amidotransferase domain-containing protein [Acerihabitans sp. TG2]|uniref:type 1 glutamine amidotransferase domain-containing protein n=1 Tax=Acerihabitans sp. TG2 TaxID=3096008 RepID=UPI002B22718B|nr:type 1 glutamine amidotransferase domain-containing protein [Acerihabitans sp. TG2]MEA9392916.1 type 1 glutamine amidotransferase domain-containing protein [Acerihabitans sp. TG2]
MGKKIAVLITEEFEDTEFTSPAQTYRQAGHQVITIEKKAGNTVTGKQGGAQVIIDKSIDEVSVDEFDALLLPGGHSPDALRGDDRFVDFTRAFAKSGKPIFAICHGPQLLISADVVRGKKMTSAKPVVIELQNAGADVFNKEVVVDNDVLVTSRTPDDLPAFNRESLRILNKKSA